MSDGSTNCKRQRLAVDDQQNMGEVTARTRCWPDPVPSEVFLRVLSFLDCPKRQELTLVNKRFWNEVETYSKKLYETIKNNHRVEPTFETRVRDQSNIQTVLEKPVNLPYRYMVKVSGKAPLYSLIRVKESRRIHPVMSLSPSENRVAVVKHSSLVQVYDLLSRQHVAGFALQNVRDVFMLDDSRIITCRNHRFDAISIWTESETGIWSSARVLQHNIPFPFGLFGRSILSGQEIIYFGKQNHDLICISVNINDGSIQRRFTISCGSTIRFYQIHEPSGENNRWLIFSIRTAQKSGGLFIYNLETNQRTFFLPETMLTFRLIQMPDCSNTFCTLKKERDDKAVIIFSLSDDGRLLERVTFPIQSGRYLVGAFQSKVFVKDDADKVVSYHADTGEQCQSPLGSAIHPGKSFRWCVSKSRNELLTVRYKTDINAFCLQEPQFI